MLPRSRRVSRRDFVTIGLGQFIGQPAVSLRVYKRQSSTLPSNFSFVVSKKVSLSAVGRNKLKRRAKSIVGSIFPETKNGLTCLFFFKKEAMQMSYQQLKEVILKLLSLGGVIN